MTLAYAVSDFLYRSTAGNLLAALAFGGVVFVAATYALRSWNIRRIRTRLEPHVPVHALAERKTGMRERFPILAGLFERTDALFGRFRIWGKLAFALEQADSSLRPAEFFYITLGSGFVLAVLFALFRAPAVFVILVFVLGAVPPIVVLMQKAARRKQAFDEQLADLLLTMGGSLRAGHTFRQAMQTIVDEGDEPAAKEFKRVLFEVSIGRPVELALEDMAARMGSRNFEYVISVISVQREVGGNLATLFDMVSETVRQRQQFSRRVRAVTAMGRLSAYVLTVMPFFVAGVATLLNPGYIKPLFTTSSGHVLIIVALLGIALGGLMLKKIVSFRMS